MEYVKDLKSVSLKDLSLVGGKAGNLGELVKIGMNVPTGFVITTELFSEYRKTGKISRTAEQQIMSAFFKLKTKKVSVRSSATVEDGKANSFAGQFDTFLNVDKQNLVKSIKDCIDSINGERVLAYCGMKKIDVKKVKMAVVVQKMIDSDVSGIAFSVNPVSGNKKEIVIEAGYGLGEGIVSGKITPDTYIIGKKPLKILSKQVSVQQELLDIMWKQVPKGLQGRQKLSDKDIKNIAEIIGQIEKHYGHPVDVEWALQKGMLWVLQSRAVTGMK